MYPHQEFVIPPVVKVDTSDGVVNSIFDLTSTNPDMEQIDHFWVAGEYDMHERQKKGRTSAHLRDTSAETRDLASV